MSEKIESEVFELIRKSNYKQCHEIIGQWKKRYPNNAHIDILEIYVNFKQFPKKFDYEKLFGSRYGLQGTEYIGDRHALSLAHKLFFEMERYEEALNIYEKAVFKYPSFELSYFWFDQALSVSNFKHMAKSSLQLSKLSVHSKVNMGETRDYAFWYAISVLGLVKFQKNQISEQELKILPLLAYKTLTNAKPFQSGEELIIFCRVCEELFKDNKQKSQEIVDEIMPTLGKSVNLSLKDIILNHARKIENYQAVFDSSIIILKKLDDFTTIKHLIYASYKLQKSKEETLALIKDLIGESRNYRLSHFESDVQYDKSISSNSLKSYLTKFHNKSCCVTDLKKYYEYLNEEVLKSAFTSCQPDDLIHDSNYFKFFASEEKTDMVACYNQHEKTLNAKAPTDYSSESVFIIAFINQKLLSKEFGVKDAIICLKILEEYQKKDVHNFDTKLLIIVMYMYLGCVPLAYSNYLELKIKNVQHDLVDHLIYTRMSSLFPQKQHTFHQKFQETNDTLYGSTIKSLSNMIRISFEKKAYSKILGMLEFSQKLESSSLKRLRIVESLQMSRLYNDKKGALIEKLHSSRRVLEANNIINLSDNRDWEIFGKSFNKKSLPDAFQYMDVSQTAINLRFLQEWMIEMIQCNEKNSKLESLLNTTLGPDVPKIVTENMSLPEALSFQIFYDLYSGNGEKCSELVSKLSAVGTGVAWKLSHNYLTILATLKTLDSLKSINDKATKLLIRECLQKHRDSCDDKYDSYITTVKTVCSQIKKEDFGAFANFSAEKTFDCKVITDCIRQSQKSSRNF